MHMCIKNLKLWICFWLYDSVHFVWTCHVLVYFFILKIFINKYSCRFNFDLPLTYKVFEGVLAWTDSKFCLSSRSPGDWRWGHMRRELYHCTTSSSSWTSALTFSVHFCLFAWMHHMHKFLKRPRENIRSLGKGVSGICKQLCGCQE